MKILLVLLMLSISGCAASPSAPFPSELSGKWTLLVEDVGHNTVSTLRVRFTDESADSCMAGDWKVVKIVSSSSGDNSFFSSSEALSYRLQAGELTIGRNQVCDDYVWLQGFLEAGSAQGKYFSFGLEGSSPLGYFKLSRDR